MCTYIFSVTSVIQCYPISPPINLYSFFHLTIFYTTYFLCRYLTAHVILAARCRLCTVGGSIITIIITKRRHRTRIGWWWWLIHFHPNVPCYTRSLPSLVAPLPVRHQDQPNRRSRLSSLERPTITGEASSLIEEPT